MAEKVAVSVEVFLLLVVCFLHHSYRRHRNRIEPFMRFDSGTYRYRDPKVTVAYEHIALGLVIVSCLDIAKRSIVPAPQNHLSHNLAIVVFAAMAAWLYVSVVAAAVRYDLADYQESRERRGKPLHPEHCRKFPRFQKALIIAGLFPILVLSSCLLIYTFTESFRADLHWLEEWAK